VVVGVDQAQPGTSASNLTFNGEGMFSLTNDAVQLMRRVLNS